MSMFFIFLRNKKVVSDLDVRFVLLKRSNNKSCILSNDSTKKKD